MTEIVTPIAVVRDSVCAILRIHKKQQSKSDKKRGKPPQFHLAFAGTAWCIVENKYLITAHHVLNNGKPRDKDDKFYAFTVPGNGPMAYHFPISNFLLEDGSLDIAILEVGAPATPGQKIPCAPITFQKFPDGTKVLTYGFPSPVISAANLDEEGNWRGGQLFLKAHANEGIIAGQFEIDAIWWYELNVGWHHGESGGPIFCLEPLAAFALMQQYRNIQTPHGIVAGPHAGRSLASIEQKLRDVGAMIV